MLSMQKSWPECKKNDFEVESAEGLFAVMAEFGCCVQYMEKEEAVNILQFWLAADNFQVQLAAKKGQYDGQEAQNDAMILYDK